METVMVMMVMVMVMMVMVMVMMMVMVMVMVMVIVIVIVIVMLMGTTASIAHFLHFHGRRVRCCTFPSCFVRRARHGSSLCHSSQ